jgi:PAS domain S-box-containing protein
MGYEPEDVIGKYFYDFFSPDNKEELKKAMLRIFSEKEPCVDFLHNDVRRDGKIITIETNGVPIINDDGELVGYRGVNRDITERKKAEEAMKQLNRDLESTIAKVEEANDNLKKFVYVASHDLREPLRKITSFGELLKNSLDGKICEDETENLNYMIDGAERMSQMIEGLLSYSRVSTKGQTSQAVDLSELIEQLKGLELSVLIDEKKVTLEIPQDLPYVEADPVQIRQLLQNLIANGIKYQKKDSKPCITITSRPADDGMVRIEVADNGIGIKPEYQSEVFKMFRRLHSRNEYEGTGIGLSVCKKIVERHGGRIGVESEYGQGSVFWFAIPAAKTVGRKQG